MHAATILFGMSAIFGAMVESSAVLLVSGRALFGLATLSALCLLRGISPWKGISGRILSGLTVTGVLLSAHFVAFFMAVKLGGVAVGTLGFACFPAFVTLSEAVAFCERPKKREYILITLVTLGLILITPSFSLADTATEGLLWGVVSGAVYALVAVANRFAAANVSGVLASWWQNLAIIACLLPFTAAGLPAIPARDWFWIACLGILCTGLAYTLYVNSLTAIKARLAALIIALEPVYAILMAWMFFQETPGPRMIAGGLLIVGSVIWAGRK